MTEPLVTILMPTYRRPAYLRQALTAAVRQSYANLQIIVRDNASGDSTPEVVRKFNDPRIEFLQSSHTVSPSDNGTECLRRARGKYCMTLADDDLIEPNYVEVLTRALEEGDELAIAYAGGVLMDEKANVIERKGPLGSYAMDTVPFLMAWCRNELPLVTPASMLMRVDWIREITAQIQNDRFTEGHNADNAFMIWVALRGKIFFTDKTMYSYRVHQGNTCMRLTSAQGLSGDRALLKFIRGEREGASANRLTSAEWGGFQSAAKELLARTYYWRVISKDLPEFGWRDCITFLLILPIRVFGLALVIRMLLRQQNNVKSWLKGQILGSSTNERLAQAPSHVGSGAASIPSGK